jgi:4-hydroxy-tetrahydrodipicolinate synthase
MLPETTLRIAQDMSNVIGIKEASGKIEQIEEVIRNRQEGFLVLSGDDGMAVDVMRRGGDGVISVAANLFPQQFGECIKLATKGEFEKADEAYAPYDEVVQALFAEGNPTGIKCALKAKGLIGGTMRLPLVEGSQPLFEKFVKFIEIYDLH